MHISQIIDFNKNDSEAEIFVSDGNYSVICYAFPVKSISLNQDISGLHGFLCTDIVRSLDGCACVKKLPQHYAYCLTGKVISKLNCIVLLGKIIIYLDSAIPKDIHEGEYVSFRVQRLDLIDS